MSIVFLPLYDDLLNILKSSLATALPKMKSSHRLEAFARAAGYGSWAALMSAMKAGSGAYTHLSSEKFMEFARSVGSSEGDRDLFVAGVLDATNKINESIIPSSKMPPFRRANVLSDELEGPEDGSGFASAGDRSRSGAVSTPSESGERTLIIVVIQEAVRMRLISDRERASIIERANTKIFAKPGL